jgi:Protein of unknown function (DUF2848)
MSHSQPLHFTSETRAGKDTFSLSVRTFVIAGWTGHDRDAMEKHISELEELGVKRPPSVPVFYRASAARLTQNAEIDVPGASSSGEVEFFLLRHKGELLVGVGSDHTDREVETYSVTVSKQMCEKPIATSLWPYAEVADHWDRLILRSWVLVDGKEAIYQEGSVATMLPPAALLEKYASLDGPFADDTLMFCGTMSAIGGVKYSPRFSFELADPVLQRRIAHSYTVGELPARG